VISSKTSLISCRSAANVCIFALCSCRLDQSGQMNFGLRPDIWSDLVEFQTDFEDKTERLSSLEKFMQIRSQTEVWSKN